MKHLKSVNKNHKNKKIGLVLACATALSPTVFAADTTFQYGGYIKFDAIFSQYSDAQRAANVGDDFLVPSTIAVGDGSGKGNNNFDSNAKFSRLFFKTSTQTDVGLVKSHIEMDFNAGNDERLTNQASNGLRHAFFTWEKEDGSSVTAGQTWSTFFNVGALPEAVDFIGPTSGSIFIRQPQVRYTMPMGNGKLMVAAENPSVSLYAAGGGTDNNAVDNSTLPDLVVRYDGKGAGLNYSAAAMLRDIHYVSGSTDEAEQGFAISFSGKYAFENGDDFKFMLSQGTLGRYIALNAFRDGAVQADGSIELTSTMGGFVAYKHMWSSQLRSTVSYAFAQADNDSNTPITVTKSIDNMYVNLMYSPTKALTFGGEYILANRETESGADGDLSRIQFTSKFAF